jgi:hypothetical protein
MSGLGVTDSCEIRPGAFSKVNVFEATQQLDESSGHLTVARATLAQIEPEIAARRADLAALENRWNEFAGAALAAR